MTARRFFAAAALVSLGALAACGGSSSQGWVSTSTADPTAIAAADPTVAPTTTPDPTSVPTPDTSAYTSKVAADAHAIATAMGAEGAYIKANPVDFAGMVQYVNATRDTAASMLADMNAGSPPPAFAAADGQMRHALSLLISGCELQAKGLTNLDPTEITDGTAMVSQANDLIAAATALIP